MNQSEFEAQLKAEGYQEIELQELAPRPGKGRHRHHFNIRGLVLSGTFLVTQDSDPVTYGPGQIFAVAEGELHDESIGSDGARVLIGRKFSKTKTSAGASSSR
jgi:quercetin dioxygenase-like cupin family protein